MTEPASRATFTMMARIAAISAVVPPTADWNAATQVRDGSSGCPEAVHSRVRAPSNCSALPTHARQPTTAHGKPPPAMAELSPTRWSGFCGRQPPLPPRNRSPGVPPSSPAARKARAAIGRCAADTPGPRFVAPNPAPTCPALLVARTRRFARGRPGRSSHRAIAPARMYPGDEPPATRSVQLPAGSTDGSTSARCSFVFSHATAADRSSLSLCSVRGLMDFGFRMHHRQTSVRKNHADMHRLTGAKDAGFPGGGP